MGHRHSTFLHSGFTKGHFHADLCLKWVGYGMESGLVSMFLVNYWVALRLVGRDFLENIP